MPADPSPAFPVTSTDKAQSPLYTLPSATLAYCFYPEYRMDVYLWAISRRLVKIFLDTKHRNP